MTKSYSFSKREFGEMILAYLKDYKGFAIDANKTYYFTELCFSKDENKILTFGLEEND